VVEEAAEEGVHGGDRFGGEGIGPAGDRGVTYHENGGQEVALPVPN